MHPAPLLLALIVLTIPYAVVALQQYSDRKKYGSNHVYAGCSVPWTVDSSGFLNCSGDLVVSSSTILADLSLSDIQSLLVPTVGIFVIAYVFRLVIRFVLRCEASRY